MSERRTAATGAIEGNAMFFLGKVEGQLREVIQAQANLSSKADALSLRLAALEAESHQRKGAATLWTMILKSPAIGWLIGADQLASRQSRRFVLVPSRDDSSH